MKKNRWIPCLVAGLALTSSWVGNVAQATDTTNLISNTTFEEAVYDEAMNLVTPDGRPQWPWGYAYAWGYDPNPNVGAVQDTYYRYPEDAPTNTLAKVLFDTSGYINPPAGAGFGQGFGAGLNWLQFKPETVWPTNLQYYIMSFDARVEGLKPGVTETWTEMQSQFDVPAGTIQPPPVVIDNIKLERLYVGCPPLNLTVDGVQVTVAWASPSSGTAQLQAANSITGAWQNVTTTNNTYTVPVAQAPKFFRTAWVPPQ